MAVLGSVASPFYKVGDATSNRFQAVLAVPYSEEPGEMALQILPKGDLSSAKEFPVKITEVDRPVERIRVSRKFTSRRRRSIAMLNDPSLTREQVYQRVTLHKYWDGSFHFPIDSKITSPFGTQRTFNRKMHSFHAGVDFHAPIGTPVSPSAPGVVVISRKMFATGNTIVIDHGYGIFTIYAHLSRLKVKVGSLVNTDSIIGLTGKTGRVHGAHLHWGAVVRGVRVNSMDLVKWLG
jgi:murein DD-endopeptidase MepM/ murein hydrolase activator NlpD